MSDSFYLAWKYLAYHRARAAILIACVTLLAVLPLTLEALLAQSEKQLLSRSQSTPLLLGARGSALDLVMNGLYFDDEVPPLISMAAVEEVEGSGLATPIPLYVRFEARRFPIVGTTLEYFDFRSLRVVQGRRPALLGECALGAEAAARLGIPVGDSLLSSPETVFDLAGVYPLKMRVVGILEPTHTPDDLAVFVDVKTAWVVEGIGHGHQDVTGTPDPSVIIERTDANVVASARLVEYNEITEQNIASFHFHGAANEYPLSGVIAIPHDTRSGTLLRGRYLDGETDYQLVVPASVIDGLLANIFRIKNVLDAVIAVVGTAAVLALILVFALSLRLRQREFHTVFRLGGSRLTVVRLLAAEITIVVGLAGMLCAAAVMAVETYSVALVRTLFIG